MDENQLEHEKLMIEDSLSSNSPDDLGLEQFSNQINNQLAISMIGAELTSVSFRVIFFVAAIGGYFWDLSVNDPLRLLPIIFAGIIWSILRYITYRQVLRSRKLLLTIIGYSGRRQWVDSLAFARRDSFGLGQVYYNLILLGEPFLWVFILLLAVFAPFETGFSGGSGDF